MSFYQIICWLALAASGTFTGFCVGYCLGFDKGAGFKNPPEDEEE